jgi:hypothetical protein
MKMFRLIRTFLHCRKDIHKRTGYRTRHDGNRWVSVCRDCNSKIYKDVRGVWRMQDPDSETNLIQA